MAYALVIHKPHTVIIDAATREHLLWLKEQRPGAVFNYKVLHHRDDDTLEVEFHFEDAEDAAIFRLFHG